MTQQFFFNWPTSSFPLPFSSTYVFISWRISKNYLFTNHYLNLRDLFYHVQPIAIVLISDTASTVARLACIVVVLWPPVRSQFHNMTRTIATKMQSLCRNYLQRRDDEHYTTQLNFTSRRVGGCHPLSSLELAVSCFSPFRSSLVFHPQRGDNYLYKVLYWIASFANGRCRWVVSFSAASVWFETRRQISLRVIPCSVPQNFPGNCGIRN
jgi:hypothetical protein